MIRDKLKALGWIIFLFLAGGSVFTILLPILFAGLTLWILGIILGVICILGFKKGSLIIPFTGKTYKEICGE